ncbi:MAG: FkbM family methyltransferase [Bacteroidales bacterium]
MPIIIYGAGNNGKKLLQYFQNAHREVLFFLDKTPKNSIDNKAVFSLLEIPEIDRSKVDVYISIFNRDVDVSVIQQDLLALHFVNVYSMMELVQQEAAFANHSLDSYWLTSPVFFETHKKQFEQAQNLFTDPESISIFQRTFQARLLAKAELLPKPRPIEEQYFSEDIPLKNVHSFVDAGAFDGDTLPFLLKKYPALHTYLGFEPDQKNFDALSKQIKLNYAKQINNISIYPCGLWSKTEILKFSDNNGEASAIGESSEGISIQCLALDQVVFNTQIDYIKMDIEGAELQALYGAEQTIRTHQPNLAICVYHQPEHLYTIPLLLNSWHLGYTFYLRQYGFYGFDLVLYAIPTLLVHQ